MKKENRFIKRLLKLETASAVFPYLLLSFVCGAVVSSWGIKPGDAAVYANFSSGFPGGSPVGSPSPDPCDSDPEGVNGTLCHDKGSESNPSVAFAETPGSIALSGPSASLSALTGRLPGNKPPTADSLTLTASVNEPVSLTLSGSDPDGDEIEYSIRIYPQHGTISRTNAEVTYTPDPEFEGQDVFAYAASDGYRSGGAVVQITVGNSSNPPPVISINDESIQFQEIKSMSAEISDSEPVSSYFNAPDLRGDLSGTPDNFRYDPLNKFGADYFYVVAREDGASGQVSMKMVKIMIGDPSAETALYDGDPEQGGPQIALSQGGYGTVEFTGINTTMLPDGPRTFTIKTTDLSGRSVTASGDVIVDNTPPSISWVQKPNQTYIRQNITLEVAAADNVRVDSVKFEVVFGGKIVRSEFLNQTPYRKQNYDIQGLVDGQHLFRFYALDDAGNVSPLLETTYIVDNSAPQQTVMVDNVVRSAGSTPVNVSGDVTIQVDGSDIVSGLGSISLFIGSDPVAKATSSTSPLIYVWNSKSVVNGAYAVTAKTKDGAGNETVTILSNVVVTNNTAPVANNQAVVLSENNSISITLTATNLDGDQLTYATLGNPIRGALSGTPPNLTYTPLANFNGTDGFNFNVTDGSLSSTAHITLTVNGVNNVPVATNQAVSLGMNGSLNIVLSGNDPEFSSVTFSILTPPLHGALSFMLGQYQYIPEPDYVGPDSFTFLVNDGLLDSAAGTISIDVIGTPVNNPPVANSQSLNVAMDDSRAITLTASDPEGAPLDFNPGTPPAHGQLTGTMPNVTYTPFSKYKGPDSFTFTVTDGVNPSVEAAISLTVADTIAPLVTIQNPASGAALSGTVSVNVTASDNDAVNLVQIAVDGSTVSAQSIAPFGFSLNTNNLSNGAHVIAARATDLSGNFTDTSIPVTVSNVIVIPAPTVAFTNPPTTNTLASGVTTIKVNTTGQVTGVTLRINGVPTPMQALDQNNFTYTWDTGILEGSIPLVATANGPGGTGEASTVVKVDNTAPHIEWRRPKPSQALLGLSNVVAFTVDASDLNGIDHVEFWFQGNKYVIADAFGTEYTFQLQTKSTSTPDGSGYVIKAMAVDKAGNATDTGNFPFVINNTNPPPSQASIAEFPLDGAYVTAVPVITAEFGIGIQLPVDSTNLKVFVSKDGVNNQQLAGAVAYNAGKLTFTGNIPSNSQVTWVVSVRDINNQLVTGQFKFTMMMRKDVGGEAYYDVAGQSRLKISVPPGSLSEDMFVAIDPIAEPANTLTNPTANVEDQRGLAGPFKVYGRNSLRSDIKELAHPAQLIYADLLPPQQSDEQNRAVQIQSLDGLVWRPIGLSEVAQMSDTSPVGTRTVSVSVHAFATIRVISVPVPAAGIDGVFCDNNPFSPNSGGTNIVYSLSADSDVTIVIYDLFGNLVRKLQFPAGSNGGTISNNPHWDGRNGEGEAVANGGYILQIIAKDSSGKESKARYKVGVVK